MTRRAIVSLAFTETRHISVDLDGLLDVDLGLPVPDFDDAACEAALSGLALDPPALRALWDSPQHAIRSRSRDVQPLDVRVGSLTATREWAPGLHVLHDDVRIADDLTDDGAGCKLRFTDPEPSPGSQTYVCSLRGYHRGRHVAVHEGETALLVVAVSDEDGVR